LQIPNPAAAQLPAFDTAIQQLRFQRIGVSTMPHEK
jgi:hypothetical protein